MARRFQVAEEGPTRFRSVEYHPLGIEREDVLIAFHRERVVRNTRMALLMLNVVHSNELYGNLVTTMRIKNIVPPSSEPRPAQQGGRQ